jgi:RND superfamily putative drug exporter
MWQAVVGRKRKPVGVERNSGRERKGTPLSVLSTAGLARLSARRPWSVVGVWLVILLLAIFSTATSLSDALTTDSNFLNNPESVRGFDRLKEGFGQKDPLTETVIVTSTDKTVDDPAFQQVVVETTAALRGLTGLVNTAPTATYNYYEAKAASPATAEQLVSKDRKTTVIPVTLLGEVDAASDRADEFRTTVKAHATGEIETLTVGDISIGDEFNTIAEEDLQKAEVLGIPAALIILVVVFGALVAAGIPVILALFSIAVAFGLTAFIGHFVDLSFFITNMITMIGLAVGIDYALFIVERYREERRRGRPKQEAIEIAGGTASKAVLFSGMTVVFALFGLFLIPTTIFRSLGLGAILVVVVAVLAMLTLIPAVLSLLGDRVDWPRRRTYDEATAAKQAAFDHETIHSGFWGRITRVVMGRPVVAVVLAVGLLLAAAVPYFDLHTGSAGVETLPQSDVKRGFEILQRDFSAGRLAPVEIVVSGRKDDPKVTAAIADLSAKLPHEGFAAVDPVQWNAAGDVALIRATLATNPNDPAAADLVVKLRTVMIPRSFAAVPQAEVLVTGDTAFNKDFFDLVAEWTPLVFAFVLGLSFILLMIVFRSIVVPAKAIVMNLLSVGAAYGLLVFVFQKGYLHGFFGFQKTPTIEAWIPIFLFCVLFGLSMDYHVFLLSRIREHYDATKRNQESVAVGLQSTARIITGAALIMVAVFVGFASGRLVMLQQVGFGLAVAVFLDATVVRSILVPASMRLLGDWNWYLPTWLKWLPDLRVEGGAIAAPRRVAEAAGD